MIGSSFETELIQNSLLRFELMAEMSSRLFHKTEQQELKILCYL